MPEFELIAACWTTAGACEPLVLTTEARCRSETDWRPRAEPGSRSRHSRSSTSRRWSSSTMPTPTCAAR